LIFALLKYDFLVLYPINPSTLAHYRQAFSTSGAKDDPRDDEYAIELLIHHRDRLKAWRPDDDKTRTLQYLVEHRRRVVSDRTQISNRMTALLKQQYAKKIDLVSRHWSGKHRKLVCGINLITLLWTAGDRYIPCDYRFYDKPTDGATKNDHFRKMLLTAKERGFRPACVLFDSWYGSLDNLKTIRNLGWF
jgi:hypothetical protein